MMPVEELVQRSDVELNLPHGARRALQSVARERGSCHLQHSTVEQRI